MSASIKITFAMDGGRDYSLSISNCPYPLAAAKVKDGIKDIIESNSMLTTYGKPLYAKKAILSVPDIVTIDVRD